MTIDPDVARLIKEAMHRERRPMKQVVNDALRRGLRPPGSTGSQVYRLTPHQSELRTGLDLISLNRLSDELDDEELLTELMDRRRPRT